MTSGIAMNSIWLSVKVLDEATKDLKKVAQGINGVGQSAKNTGKDFNSLKNVFAGAGFFALFTIGRIKTVMQGWLESSLRIFSQMDAGFTQQGRAASWLLSIVELLKYTIGQSVAKALLPFKQNIHDTVDEIISFISENERLVTSFGAAGVALGGMAGLVGSILLLLWGTGSIVIAGLILLFVALVAIFIFFFTELKLQGEDTNTALNGAFEKTASALGKIVWNLLVAITILVNKFILKLGLYIIHVIQGMVQVFIQAFSTMALATFQFVQKVINSLMPLWDAFAWLCNQIDKLWVRIANRFIDCIEWAFNGAIDIINDFLSNPAVQWALGKMGFEGTISKIEIERVERKEYTGEGIATALTWDAHNFITDKLDDILAPYTSFGAKLGSLRNRLIVANGKTIAGLEEMYLPLTEFSDLISGANIQIDRMQGGYDKQLKAIDNLLLLIDKTNKGITEQSKNTDNQYNFNVDLAGSSFTEDDQLVQILSNYWNEIQEQMEETQTNINPVGD